uniref:Uncharacterized protein n=1 Tax=Strigamia maritima TaxID=126957 RepID=T1JL18_STRMM
MSFNARFYGSPRVSIRRSPRQFPLPKWNDIQSTREILRGHITSINYYKRKWNAYNTFLITYPEYMTFILSGA